MRRKEKKTLQSPLITVVHLTAVFLKVLELGCMLYLSVAPGEFSFSNSCKSIDFFVNTCLCTETMVLI